MIGRLGVAYLLSVDSSVGGFLEESPWSLISKVCWPEERRKQTERGQMDMILFPKAANNSARRNLHVAQLYWSFDILCHANVSPADVIDKSWCRLGMFLAHLHCFASHSNNLSQNMKEIGGVLLAVWWNGLFLKVAWSIYIKLVYKDCKSNFWLNQILNSTWLLLVLLLQVKYWFSRCLMFRDWFNSCLIVILRKWFSSCVGLREWFSSCVGLGEWSSSCLRLGEWLSLLVLFFDGLPWGGAWDERLHVVMVQSCWNLQPN